MSALSISFSVLCTTVLDYGERLVEQSYCRDVGRKTLKNNGICKGEEPRVSAIACSLTLPFADVEGKVRNDQINRKESVPMRLGLCGCLM